MKKLRLLYAFIFISILMLSEIGLSIGERASSFNPDQPEYFQQKFSQDPTLQNIAPEEVTADRINNGIIPKDMLTKALARKYNKNPNYYDSILQGKKFGLIRKGTDERLQVYKGDSNEVDFEFDPESGEKIEKTDAGIKIDDNEFSSAFNIRWDNAILKADASNGGIKRVVINPNKPTNYQFTGIVNYLEDKNTILVNALNPKSTNNIITVDNAQEVKSADLAVVGDNIFRSIRDSKFVVDDTGKLISAEIVSNRDNNEITLAQPNVDLTLDRDGTLDLKGNELTISNGELAYQTSTSAMLQIKETVISPPNKPATIVLDFSQLNGFYTLKLSKGAEYIAELGGIKFKIIPKIDDYSIYIQKAGVQSFNFGAETNFAFIDFVKKEIKLNSLADYYYNDIKVIESNDENNRFELKFTDDFTKADLKLTNDNVVYRDIAVIYISEYKLTETQIGSSIHTVAEFSSQADHITSYEHKFNLPYLAAKITLQDSKLVQESAKNKVTVFPSNTDFSTELSQPEWCRQYDTSSLLNANVVAGSYQEPNYLFIAAAFLIITVISVLVKKQNKKSQITVFIMIGVMILVVFVIMYTAVMQARSISYSTLQPLDTSSVQSYTKDCLNRLIQCSLAKQGITHSNLDTASFQRETKKYLDQTMMKCHDAMPNDLKQDVKLTYFESNIYYGDRSIIQINTDMIVRNDMSEQGLSNYEFYPQVNLKPMLDFANSITSIDLTHLGSVKYNIDVYGTNSKPIYIITDPDANVFDKGFKLVVG